MRDATAGGRGRGPRWALLCTMDWVDEAPERELPDRDEERELGFTSLAFGASASSLWLETKTENNDDNLLFSLFNFTS